jgi:hypothetical protein
MAHSTIEVYRGAVPKTYFDFFFTTQDSDGDFQLPILGFYDARSKALGTFATTKENDKSTVELLRMHLETWGHTKVIVQCDGEPATCFEKFSHCS